LVTRIQLERKISLEILSRANLKKLNSSLLKLSKSIYWNRFFSLLFSYLKNEEPNIGRKRKYCNIFQEKNRTQIDKWTHFSASYFSPLIQICASVHFLFHGRNFRIFSKKLPLLEAFFVCVHVS